MIDFIHPAPVGSVFKSRMEVKAAGLHKHLQAGIDFDKDRIAEAIVVSGGYSEDQDFGDRIIYTGQGGQSALGSGVQVSDQKIERGNLALVNAELTGTPVRVIRGAGGDKRFSPDTGYRYDGFYEITQHWFEFSKDGPSVVRFELIKCEDEVITPTNGGARSQALPPPQGVISPRRISKTSSSQPARDPRVPAWIKSLYRDECQICWKVIRLRDSTYSEGAHIQGIGFPHYGPDILENMLCLCPNCHTRFDKGALYVTENLKAAVDVVTGDKAMLRVRGDHEINPEYVVHHRVHVAGIR
jgi:putative restriction endonuclease